MKFEKIIDPCELYNKLDHPRQEFCSNFSEFCDDLPINNKRRLYNLLLLSLPNVLLQPGKRYIFEAIEQCIDSDRLSQDLQQRYSFLKEQGVELGILLKSNSDDLSVHNNGSLLDVLMANPKYIKTKVITVLADEDDSSKDPINGEKIPHYRTIIKRLYTAGSSPTNPMKGSHQLWSNKNGDPFIVTRPHGSKRMNLGTLKSMLRNAKISQQDFYNE